MVSETARKIAHEADGIIDKLKSLGAEFKTDGVWRLGDKERRKENV